MSDIYIRNSVKSNQMPAPQPSAVTPLYNVPVPPRYSGVAVASPVTLQMQRRAESEQVRSDSEADGSERDTVITDTAVGEQVGDGAAINEQVDESVGKDTANYDTDGALSDDGAFGLYKRVPLEPVPDGYNCRGEPRRPDFRGLADFDTLVGIGARSDDGSRDGVRDVARDLPQSVPRDTVREQMPGTMYGSNNGGRPDSEWDAMNLLKNLAASVDSDDLLIAALIIMMLAERSADSAVDDYVLLILAFLLLSGR